MKNRPLVIPEPQAHKELNPSLMLRLGGGSFKIKGATLPFL